MRIFAHKNWNDMKQMIIMVAMLAMLGACSNEETANVEEQIIVNEPEQPKGFEVTYQENVFALDETEYTKVPRLNEFALSLFREQRKANVQNSMVLSPLSVAFVLGMLNEGSEGQTGKEIVNTLGLDGMDHEHVNGLFKKMIDGLQKDTSGIVAALANNVTVNNKYSLKKDYSRTVNDNYKALALSLDFSSPQALQTINSWCSEQTHGLIPSIVDDLSPDVVMCLLNAIYFKGLWSHAFDEANSRPVTFFYPNGDEAELKTANQLENVEYFESEELKAIRLPFGDSSYAMTLLLPMKNNGLESMMKKITAEMIYKMQFTNYQVLINLPIFQTQTTTNLKPVLNKLDIVTAFGDNAQFTRMADIPQSLYVSKMEQKARLGIDEKGCEGAAVTIAELIITSDGEDKGGNTVQPQRIFTANHPFVYMITEKTTGAILFLGQFCGE